MQRDEITEVVFLHIVPASNSTKVKKYLRTLNCMKLEYLIIYDLFYFILLLS